MHTDALSINYARELDRRDPLAGFRERFVFADPDLIYMDGNSLGRLPKATVPHLDDVVQRQWGERLIRGWNEGWMDLAGRVRLRFIEAGADYDVISEEAVLGVDDASVSTSEIPLAMTRAEGRQTGERWLSESRVATDTVRLTLPRSRLAVGAGADCVDVSFDPASHNGSSYPLGGRFASVDSESICS